MWFGIILYSNKLNSDDESDDYDNSNLLLLGRILSGIWIASVIAIAVKCESGYRRTFISTSTARTFQREVWHFVTSKPVEEAGSQNNRSLVIGLGLVGLFGKIHYDIYGHFVEELKVFIDENFEIWVREKPKWFTKKFISSIPMSVLTDAIKEEVMIDAEHAKAEEMRLEAERRKRDSLSLRMKLNRKVTMKIGTWKYARKKQMK
jgi:hypothetical protein